MRVEKGKGEKADMKQKKMKRKKQTHADLHTNQLYDELS